MNHWVTQLTRNWFTSWQKCKYLRAQKIYINKELLLKSLAHIFLGDHKKLYISILTAMKNMVATKFKKNWREKKRKLQRQWLLVALKWIWLLSDALIRVIISHKICEADLIILLDKIYFYGKRVGNFFCLPRFSLPQSPLPPGPLIPVGSRVGPSAPPRVNGLRGHGDSAPGEWLRGRGDPVTAEDG